MKSIKSTIRYNSLPHHKNKTLFKECSFRNPSQRMDFQCKTITVRQAGRYPTRINSKNFLRRKFLKALSRLLNNEITTSRWRWFRLQKRLWLNALYFKSFSLEFIKYVLFDGHRIANPLTEFIREWTLFKMVAKPSFESTDCHNESVLLVN